ncbi:N-acetyl sugar amidotransferase [Novosphingopyxis sp. YJ-S2-01]|uniref:N-acetyl sugar amidotransferase n=1 Tax=Novosphingopyxis sp. YJ-S2-01 TaxID=2794021 RepID=UPI0018DBAD84|nr:N-acetyl sugar amidotransferase [Novosphingopyxis sp. YJ-S2-01]MBH9538449.1 N-acetyl sugar amidotransferase [Novosphingopyxis sp. YJ-S2-01]
MARPYQICTRCVMDTTDPLISFDDAGMCNHCTDFLANRMGVITAPAEGTASLETLFDQVRAAGRGNDYDCVVGVSGGVDSSYVAVLAAEHGLRVLAVHLDNGWNSKIAVENIRNLATRLKFGYASYVLPWTDFRRVQVAFLQGSVPEAETPTDVAIQRAVHDNARKAGAKYILSGGNIASEGILPKTWHYNARDTRYSHAILDAADCPRSAFASQKFGALQEGYARVMKGIRTAYPLNTISYDKAAARAKLEQEYGWQYYGAKHGESRFTRFIQTYYLPIKHSIDYRRATLASELLTGATTREEALAILETSPYADYDVDGESAYIAKKLNLSGADLAAIIAAPPKFYYDYPNNEEGLARLYDLYRRMTGRKKTSNF